MSGAFGDFPIGKAEGHEDGFEGSETSTAIAIAIARYLVEPRPVHPTRRLPLEARRDRKKTAFEPYQTEPSEGHPTTRRSPAAHQPPEITQPERPTSPKTTPRRRDKKIEAPKQCYALVLEA